MSIAIVDYGMGNVRSLKNAFEYFGRDVTITDDPQALADASRIVLPGVGAFGDAMNAIRARGLMEVLTCQAFGVRKPILGICLGMQLFARSSSEHGTHSGLAWINADVRRLRLQRGYKVPHVGWNELRFPEHDWLFRGISPLEANFYFVHSFHVLCHDASDCLATTDHGGSITAVVRKDNLVAAQFHPEKSQDNGLRFLENWVAWEP
jgi:glutamine amidotransferase